MTLAATKQGSSEASETVSSDQLPLESMPDSEVAPWQALLGAVEVRFGRGRLSELGPAAQALGAQRALLVTDPGLIAAGHAAKAVTSLEESGLIVSVFEGVEENPSTHCVENGARVALETSPSPDLMIGLGGGSALDTAKGINFVLSHVDAGARMQDFWGYGKATRPMLPMIGIPTTAGTGSDAQSYCLISQSEGPDIGRKMACGDPGARFRTVLLDPDLLASAPANVTALAGLDALSHAVESFVTTRRSPISSMLAREAFMRLDSALPRALEGRAEDQHRSDLLLGAHLAGAAIEASMLGAAHASANPLTARFGVPHGAAVSLMLPHVVRLNGSDLYESLFPAGGEALAGRIEELRRLGGLPNTLSEAGVDVAVIDELAELATREWTGGFNPRPVDANDFRRLYEAAAA